MRQLQCLTGLRGVAAYSVLMAHAAAYAYPGAPIIPHYIHGLPYFGMSLFFVLSGFVIHYNYAGMFRTDGLAAGGKKFFIARFARLYPLYFVGADPIRSLRRGVRVHPRSLDRLDLPYAHP